MSDIDWKDTVRAATTAALPLYTRVGNTITANANGLLPSADGVSLAVNDRLLLVHGASTSDNGIYTVSNTGGASVKFVLTRAADADASAEVTSGLRVGVASGSVHRGHVFALTTADPITLNTTPLLFAPNYHVFNVRDFGAQGDEALTANNPQAESLAIQACIDAAAAICRDPTNLNEGAVVYFPPGRYNITGFPLTMRRTLYRRPIIYRGAGWGASTIFNQSTGIQMGVSTNTGSAFVVEPLTGAPGDLSLGGEGHTFVDLAIRAAYGFSILWDLGDATDVNDGVRASLHLDRCFFSRTLTPGAAVRIRAGSRTRINECVVDVLNYTSGSIGFECARGSMTMSQTRGGGTLLHARDAAELSMTSCRVEGGAGLPGVDIRNATGVTISGLASEGHDEADAIVRLEGCKGVIVDGCTLAAAERGYVAMRARRTTSGAQVINFVHVPAVGINWAEENKIVRSSGSWGEDNIGPGGKIRVANATSNTGIYDVLEASTDTLWVKQTVVAESVPTGGAQCAMFPRADLAGQPSVTFSAAAHTLTRSDGSWLDDGFAVGQTITTTAAGNLGPFTVIAPLTATVLKVSEAVANGSHAGPGVRASVFAGGLVLRSCWNFDVRCCEGSDFTQLGRPTVEADANCRDGSIQIAQLVSPNDSLTIAPAAFNVSGECRALYYTDWKTLNPTFTKTYWHGRKYAESFEAGQFVAPALTNWQAVSGGGFFQFFAGLTFACQMQLSGSQLVFDAGASATMLLHAGSISIECTSASGLAQLVAGSSPLGCRLIAGTFTGVQVLSTNKVGFYGASPVVQATRPGQLTNSTGGSTSSNGGALVDVGVTPTQAKCNDNFAKLADRVNKLEAILHDLGLCS